MSKVLLGCQDRNIIKGVKDQKECLHIRMFMKYENITTVYLVSYIHLCAY
jgi:hypothetical protein